MYKQLNDELLRMQQQLNDLQGGSPVRRVKIIRETTTEASPSKVGAVSRLHVCWGRGLLCVWFIFVVFFRGGGGEPVFKIQTVWFAC